MTLELRNEPQKARAPSTLNSILDAARHVADERGWDVFTTADVAERAYVSTGTVYRYFPDRVAILDSLDPERSITAEVRSERFRQNEKWGEQNHPDGTGSAVEPLAKLNDYTVDSTAQALAGAARDANKDAVGGITWSDTFLEEVFEALAESEPAKLRTELIQVQAVAQQWVAAIDRRTRWCRSRSS